jgi:pyridoxal phosphate enzyme (YggS family)
MIATNIEKIKIQIGLNTSLIAVSKTKPVSALQEAYAAGQRIFGENKVQEMVEKHAQLPKDIEWHMIGHLQSNKVKYIAPFVSLIHGVDSLKLLEVINKEGLKNNRVIPCLLQVYIAKEETKFGLEAAEIVELLSSNSFREFKNISIYGLMGMASNTENIAQVRLEFVGLKSLFDELKANYFLDDSRFSEVSMGMSGDYQIAIEEGATLVRIGSAIFGSR